MQRIKWTAKRVALGFALSLAATAAAFFVATYLSDGTGEGKTGNAGNFAQPVSISFPDGTLTPTNPVKVTATVNNTSGASRKWKSFVMEVKTPAAPICGEQWLQLRGEKMDGSTSTLWNEIVKGTNAVPLDNIPTGVQDIFGAGSEGALKNMWLEFKPALVATTNQKSCENVPVIVTGKLTE